MTIGAISSQTVTISNTGLAPINLTHANLTGSGFTTPGLVLPLAIAANKSASFSVRFTAKVVGTSKGTLSLVIDADPTPTVVSLSADATEATPTSVLKVVPSSLSFSSVNLNTSATQAVTITNTGRISLVIGQAALSGSGFSLNGMSAPLTLAAGQSSSFNVLFTPTVAGNVTGSLTVVTEDIAASVAIPLSGNGIALPNLAISVNPNTATVKAGTPQQFAAIVTGTPIPTVTWSMIGTGCTGAACGTISPSGLYTPPSNVSSPFAVTVRATSTADPTKSASASVNIMAAAAVSLSITPSSASVTTTGTKSFSATVTGSANTSVTWTLTGTGCTGATCGTLSTNGLYTAPASVPSPATVTVRATSTADPTKAATAIVTISALPASVSVSINPTAASVSTSATQPFAATVTSSSNTAVTWTLSGAGCAGASCGNISSGGLYTAPATAPSPATVTVKATSAADPTKSASASITIVAAVAVLLSLSPTSASINTSSTQSFTATVTGTSNTAVTWALTGSGCSGPACGSLSTSSSSAVYSAPATAPAPAAVSVTATSVADATKSAAAAVTINSVVAVTVSPQNPSVAVGVAQQFSASVTGSSNTSVTWSATGSGCSGATCGIINNNGLFTAPTSVPNPAAVTITAVSAADSTKSAAATVTISAGQPTGMVTPVLPTLPQKQVDVSMPNISSYAVVQVNAGGDLQAAINTASCNPVGTVIKVHAGAVYSGPFTLPVKSCAAGQWIILRSDAPDSSLPAPGVRIAPAYESQVPVLLAHALNQPSIQVAVGASNYRIMFLEGKVDSSAYTSTSDGLLDIGDGSFGGPQNTVASQPNNIVVDRVLLRGSDNPPIGVRRGVSMQCQNCAVINSYIDQIHAIGADTQAIAGWNSTGPWLIDNNYLSAAGENILVGGADVNIPNALPTDVTITHNYFFKPMSWKVGDPTYAGTHWSVKNIYEMKVGVRFLVQGNVFQNVWADNQDGEAIKINTAGSTTTSWAQISDLTFQLNQVINAEGGFGGSNCNTVDTPDLGNQRNLYQNNLLLQIGGASGRRILIGGDSNSFDLCGMPDFYFNHNTVIASSGPATSLIAAESIVPAGVVPLQRFAFHNNLIALDSTYGVHPTCAVAGTAVPCWTTNAWWGNIFFNTNSSTCDPNSFGPHAVSCPVANIAAVGFANSTGDASGDYHLVSNSIGKKAGTDGKDVGADIDALNAAIAGVTP